MKLKFVEINGKKVYTLRDVLNGIKTSDAHSKFLKLKSVNSNIDKIK